MLAIIISSVSALAATMAATFAYKTFRVNQQRYVVMSLQVEKRAWYNRIKHFIKANVDDLLWEDKRYIKKNYKIKNGTKVSTWDELTKQKYYELIDAALSKRFKGKETMTKMIEEVFKKELKESYWEKHKHEK